jgi:hypothetical protein
VRNAEQGTEPRSGQQVILPASYTGSPRYYHQHYQDAMAIVRVYHKPDYFVTFTCNPQWPEITNSLLPNQKAQDRPDIIARVFKQKLKQLRKEFSLGVLGKEAAHMYVIEFQKRGLPHAHLLTIVDAEDRLHSSADVDEVICAELPPDPKDFPEGPQKEQAKKLQKLVLDCMTHTCSPACRDNFPSTEGKCKKGFPKDFSSTTRWNEESFYPEYRRRAPDEGGRVIQIQRGNKIIEIDNRWIVPYNPYLLLRFEGHINIEVCVSPTAAKYLFKYVTKGPDRAMVNASVSRNLDEIATYQDLRSIGPSEAVWRLCEFSLSERYPAVEILRVHLPGDEYVTFEEGKEQEIAGKPPKETELTSFFEYNRENPGTNVQYVDFPRKFVFQGRKWKARKQGIKIGRVHTINPKAGDVFFLRVLLHNDHCCGKRSFEHLKTFEGQVCETYKEVCLKLGLLHDDLEWHHALTDAVLSDLPAKIRELFVSILLFNHPANPLELFEQHVPEWWEDFKRKYPDATDEQLKSLVLEDLHKMLEFQGSSLNQFNLPSVQIELLEELQQPEDEPERCLPLIYQEELSFNYEETKHMKEQRIQSFTPSQSVVGDVIIPSIEQGDGKLFFLKACGGSGKTFSLNTYLAVGRTCKPEKSIALAVGASGIAATLLDGGRTFHSRFKVPLTITKTTTLPVKPTDNLGKLIKEAQLIVIDEAPMFHRHGMEAMDRLMQDLTKIQRPMGGKNVVAGGDFRQCLPVVPRGSRASITGASLQKSPLWKHFNVVELTENMRVGNDPSLQWFHEWLLNLGDGKLPIVEAPDIIELPERFVFPINDDSPGKINTSKLEFIHKIFPNMAEKAAGPIEDWIDWIGERAILAPKNSQVDELNFKISEIFPGEARIMSSADTCTNIGDVTRFPVEYLNSLTPTGLPPHKLHLKKGMILMLIRNLNPKGGLCNGTRLILNEIGTYVLRCTIASGTKKGNTALIPRIELTPNDNLYSFDWKRRQFPVRPAFAVTINKSQGQTLKKVGVWLEEPVFTHGQLYVAASRVGHPDHLLFAVKKSAKRRTRNVVYKEIL